MSLECRHLQTLDCTHTDVLSCLVFFFSSPEEAEPEESEEPFVAPAGLLIPPDVELVSETVNQRVDESVGQCPCTHLCASVMQLS